MLPCSLVIGTTILGAVTERYWFVPCLISWRVFRINYVVLWLSWVATFGLLQSYLKFPQYIVQLYIVESLLLLIKLHGFVTVRGGCCQTTPGIGGSFGISIGSGLSHAALE